MSQDNGQGFDAAAFTDALDVLRGFNQKAVVSYVYDSHTDFSGAMATIFGDSFEYPNFSYLRVGQVVMMAENELAAMNEKNERQKNVPVPSFSGTTKQSLAMGIATAVMDTCKHSVGKGRSLENINIEVVVRMALRDMSRVEAEGIAGQKGSFSHVDAKDEKTIFGKVMGVTDSHVILSLGRSAGILVQSDLSRVPAVGEDVSVLFKDGQGVVSDRAVGKGVDFGR